MISRPLAVPYARGAFKNDNRQKTNDLQLKQNRFNNRALTPTGHLNF